MSLRAGSYDASSPRWRGVIWLNGPGVIRQDAFPAYVCVHIDHKDRKEATACAKAALVKIKESATLPIGWVDYERGLV